MNSSDLYTGTNSGSFGNYAAKKQKTALKATKEAVKSKFLPAYELVIADIDSEIARVADINYLYVDSYVPEEQLNAELMARRRYIGYLKALKSKYTALVKDEVKHG